MHKICVGAFEKPKIKSWTTISIGFSLIELLVVISIIGFLTTLLLVATAGTRERAKDARRMQDLKTLVNGLEVYYTRYGVYPCGAYQQLPSGLQIDDDFDHTGVGANSFLNSYQVIPFTCSGGSGNGLITEGIAPPNIKDPGGSYLAYEMTADRQNYILYTQLKSPSNTSKMQQDGGLKDCFYEVGLGLGKMTPSYACPP